MVLCKNLNLPHAAELEKIVGVLMDADSLNMIAYREFTADKVVVSRLQTGKFRNVGILTNLTGDAIGR